MADLKRGEGQLGMLMNMIEPRNNFGSEIISAPGTESEERNRESLLPVER
jgi:hypothetical protein